MPSAHNDRMATPPIAPDASGSAPSTHDHRRLLTVLTLGAVVILWAGTAAFLWRDRQLTLQATSEHTARQALRLSQDLEQTLKVARTVISQFDERLQIASSSPFQPSPVTGAAANAELLAALPLPFELHALTENGHAQALVGLDQPAKRQHANHHHSDKPLAPGVWSLGDVASLTEHHTLPLSWPATPNLHLVRGYGVDLSFAALQSWLDRDRKQVNDRVSLFWLNPDGSATLLARSPNEPERFGQRVTADWVATANANPNGVIDLISQIDQQHRRVAFQRLSGPANPLVVVYGSDIRTALGAWWSQLPYLMGLTLFLSIAMGFGGWRLNRALKALTLSEQRFQLVLDSGHVWDWDIPSGTLRYTPHFLARHGYTHDPNTNRIDALFQHIVPEDGQRLKSAIDHHLATRDPYDEIFRTVDAKGNTRWFHTQGQAFWDRDGQARYMAGTTFEITERVALEEGQRQTLQRLDIVANASPVLFCTSNLHGEVDWLNRRWLAFTGRTAEQEMGQGWLAGVHPDDLPRRQAFFASVTTRQEAVSTEFRLRDKDGIYRWMVVQCLPLRNADRGINGFIVSCIDISELKKAEEAARERGAMLEATFQVLPDLLFVIDQSGRFIHFQGSAQDRLYVPPDTFLGKLVGEVMPPNIASLLERHLQLARGGTLQEFAYSLRLPGGEHHFEARMARLPESDRYMVVARDITEREHLRQFTTLQARLATEFINLPVSQIDQGINQALAEIGAFAQTDRAYIFEYDFANQRTSNTHEWCAPNTRAELGRLQNIPLSMVPDWVETHAQRQRIDIPDVPAMPPGPLRDLLMDQSIRSLITLPMCNAEGCIGFVGFDSVHSHHRYNEEQIGLLKQFAQMLVNVYDRKAAAASLQQLNAELEQRVQQRTRELDVSVQRLSHANRELESFAYSVSHDLKAPLRSVEGFASLLLDEHSASLNDEARDYLGRIQRATLHMARLISDLLGYCRMEEMDKKIEPVQLLGVVNEVIGGMRNELDARGVKMQVNVPAGVTALAHPQGLAMALRNLIDNAIKFTPPGTAPDITLSASSANGRTRLCVKDQGQGFDMRYHDRIFAIFQRLHRPEAIPGTGIGLAMVAKAVQRMNGRIWADSKPGEGAKFHIELPSA